MIDGAAELYTVERESFSLAAVPILDTFVFQRECGPAVQPAWKPYVKPTEFDECSQHVVPLSFACGEN